MTASVHVSWRDRARDVAFASVARRRLGWVWIAVWTVFLWFPGYRAVVHATPRSIAGAGALMICCAGYVTAAASAYRRAARDGRAAGSLALLGALVCALGTVAAIMLLGTDGMSAVPYLAVSLAVSLPWRFWLPLTALGTAGLLGLEHLARSWGSWNGLAIGTGAAAVGSWFGVQNTLRGRRARLAEHRAHTLEMQDERNRMARDLHDILGHSLTVIALKAELAQKLVPTDPGRAQAELDEVTQLARHALTDVRATVNNYRDVSLGAELARAAAVLSAAQVAVTLPGAIDEVPNDLQELFGWVVRETTTNVIRHADASRVVILIDHQAIAVTDDGCGRQFADEGGHGLEGLRQRALAARCVITTGPADRTRPGRPGFRVEVRRVAAAANNQPASVSAVPPRLRGLE